MDILVKHKKSGKVMKLKKDYGLVVSCWLNKSDVHVIYNKLIVDTCIVQKENCEFIKEYSQLSLFD